MSQFQSAMTQEDNLSNEQVNRINNYIMKYIQVHIPEYTLNNAHNYENRIDYVIDPSNPKIVAVYIDYHSPKPILAVALDKSKF